MCAHPDTSDGDIWGDPGDEPEPEGTSNIEIRPLIKTDMQSNDRKNRRYTATRIPPWSGPELARMQEQLSRKPGESATEYLGNVSLKGGDRILLSEEEARG